MSLFLTPALTSISAMQQDQVGCFGGFFKLKWLRRKNFRPFTNKQPNLQIQSNVTPVTFVQKSEEPPCTYFDTCCNFSYGKDSLWGLNIDSPPSYSNCSTDDTWNPEAIKIIDTLLEQLSPKLRDLSLQIHDHPELMFEERFAHDVLTTFLLEQGFTVTKHYLGLETAWRAEFIHGKGGKVLGINSEMDALTGIGHACGHNLIAISGVGVAIAIKEALKSQNVAGKVVLLGTPAEENGGGKVILLERGAYDEMDACIMCHPGPGPPHSVSVGSTIAMQGVEVEYFGHAAHAGAAPWEGTNALDAAFLAYSSISVLRQQMKPDHRIHGVIHGKNWVPNVIPDYANMRWYIRAPTFGELAAFRSRVNACFEAAALATSCRVRISFDRPYYDLRQNSALATNFSGLMCKRYGVTAVSLDSSASTDFGNVSYKLPAFHPLFAIPTTPHGGNHTAEFTRSARTQAAHDATLVITKGLAITGFRFLSNLIFFDQVVEAFSPCAQP